MTFTARLNPLARAVIIFGVIAAVVTGVTYAALQSQATLTNNTIASATAELQVKSSGSFASQDAGFAFNGVIPGGPAVPVPAEDFDLRNNGDVDLDVSVSIPTAPTWTVDPSGSVDDGKVDVVLACSNTSTSFSLTTDIASLVTAHSTGGVLMTGGFIPVSDPEVDCTAQVQMDSDAFTGESASSTNFNIVFTATATPS